MKNIVRRYILNLIAFIAISGCILFVIGVAQATPTILNYSRSGSPGDVIFLQGDSFGSSTSVTLTGGGATNLSLAVESSYKPAATGNASLTVLLPYTLSTGAYTVSVSDGSHSASVVINQTYGIDLDMPDVQVGQTIRVFGRNLTMPGETSSARFVDNSTSTSYTATINTSKSTAFILSMVAPSGMTVGHTFTVYVNNGYGETAVAQTVDVKATGDPYGLGVGWASDFSTTNSVALSPKGSGQDDTSNIQNAISTVGGMSGGGVVKLSAGTFVLGTSTGIGIANNVVLEGAGSGSTTIEFGSVSSTNIAISFGANQHNMGIADLTVENVGNVWNQSIRDSTAGASEVFMKNCVFTFGSADNFTANSINRFAMQGCTVSTTEDLNPSYITGTFGYGGSYASISGNTFTGQWGGVIGLGVGQHAVVENNTFNRDCSWEADYSGTLPLCRMMAQNYRTDDQILNNTFNLLNGPAKYNNDGETILDEGGGGTRTDSHVGTVTSATSTTLTDTNQSWGTLTSSAVVMVTYGVGTGEWLPITSVSGTTLNLGGTWKVTPTAGSRYTVQDWSGANTFIIGNTLNNGPRGIWFYTPSVNNLVIYGNTLNNNEGIQLRADQRYTSGTLPYRFNTQWNVLVQNNTVVDTNGLEPAGINVLDAEEYSDTHTWGSGILGFELRGNIVNGIGSGGTWMSDDGSELEGMESIFGYGFGNSNYVDEGVPANLTTISQNNVITNCTNALSVDTGTYDNVLWDDVLCLNATNEYDYDIYNATHASTGTVYRQPQIVQAESGTWDSKSTKYSDPLAVGGYYIRIFYSGSYVQVSGVNGGSAGGNYTLTIRYSWPNNGKDSIYVNGSKVADVTLPKTGSYDVFQNVSCTIPLAAGTSNTIKLEYDSGDGPVDLDQFAIGN